MSYDPQTYWPERFERQGEAYVGPGGHEAKTREQTKAIVPYLSYLPASGRVLDFGCGPGRFRSYLEAVGLEYEGVDLIPELGTMGVGDIEPRSFDAATAIFVLQHIVDEVDYIDALDTLYNALKPGGRLLAVDHDPTPNMAEHMAPRGVSAVVTAKEWAHVEIVGHWRGHWIGLFTK